MENLDGRSPTDVDNETQPSRAIHEAKSDNIVPETKEGTFCDSARRVLLRIKANWIKYHLLWLLILAITIGVAWPVPGKAVGDLNFNGVCLITTNSSDTGKVESICVWNNMSSLLVALIFLISGLQLKLSKMKQAFMERKAIGVGFFFIFVLTSCFGYAVAGGPKLNPPEFSFGLSLFIIMPTTLSAGIVIVGYAKGDTALALLLSVVTNLIGVAILPLTVTWMIQVFFQGSTSGGQVSVDAVDLCLNLVFTVLIPLFVGITIRMKSRIAQAIDKISFTLKVTSAASLAAIPWMKISQSSSSFSQVSAGSYVIFIVVAFGMHIWFLVLCGVSSLLVFDRKKDLAIIKCLVLVCSQKTLPVAMSMLELLPVAITGNPGLVSLAIVILQLIQTLTDSFVALKWAQYTTKVEDASEKPAAGPAPEVQVV